jgi:hypothetical protein
MNIPNPNAYYVAKIVGNKVDEVNFVASAPLPSFLMSNPIIFKDHGLGF